MERYEINKLIEQFNHSIESLTNKLNINQLEKRVIELNNLMQEQNFWLNQEKAKKISQEHTNITNNLSKLNKLKIDVKSVIDWFEISEEDTEEWEILEIDLKKINDEISKFEIEILLSEEHDEASAILEIHAGAGGTEAQDWCDMLFRMYQKYSLRKGFKTEILDYQAGEEAGVKSVVILIKGRYAYGYLKAEKGVHRLVRISPFDSNQRRHTSFAAVDVMPEIDDDIEIDLKQEDLKIDIYRSSGAGGQSVNTTDSAVRITHLPTNIVVTCQNERSQLKNKETALKILKSKLFQLELKKQDEKLKELKGEQKDIAWGSQIRSYVFHPYQMAKDHRTNFENNQINQVMDGDLDGFINAYLRNA